VPAGGKEREEPSGGAEALGGAAEVVPRLLCLSRNQRIGTLPGQVEPVDGGHVLVEVVVGPGEPEHHLGIGGIGLGSGFEILDGIL
jgi:hypothetical protein